MRRLLRSRFGILLILLLCCGLNLSPYGGVFRSQIIGDDSGTLSEDDSSEEEAVFCLSDFSGLRFGMYIDKHDFQIPSVVFSRLAAFRETTGEATSMLWYTDEEFPEDDEISEDEQISEEEKTLPIKSVSIDSQEFDLLLAQLLEMEDLADLEGLYSVIATLSLTDVWLSEGLLQKELLIDMSEYLWFWWCGFYEPLEGNYIGSGTYDETEVDALRMMKSALLEVQSAFRNLAYSNIGAYSDILGLDDRSTSDIDDSISLVVSTFASSTDGTGFADKFFTTPYSYEVMPLVYGDEPLLAEDDKLPLYSVTAKIPITVALQVPSTTVTARVYSASTVEEDFGIDEELFSFDVAEVFNYTSSVISSGIVLGWADDGYIPDVEAILEAAAEFPALDRDEDQMNDFATAVEARYVFPIERGEAVRGAASISSEGFRGVSMVILYTERNATDLSITAIESTMPPAGYVATATVEVYNATECSFDTQLRFAATYEGEASVLDMELEFDVLVDPGYNYYKVTYSTPEDGGPIYLVAEINPNRNLKECDLSNNSFRITMNSATLDLPYNVDVGPTDFVRWQEQRKHMVIKNEVVATSSSSTGGSAPVMGWRQYVCTHDYFYECSIETFLELEYLDELYGITSFADLLELKSGYGFTPQLTVVGSGPTLVEEWVAGYGVKASGDLTSGYTYCPMPISAPTRDSEASLRFPDEATWSWLPSIHLGHRHEDYEVRNSENGLRQFASGLDLQHLQTWEGVSSFTAAPNPVSATWLQRIYTNPALRNGNHGFNVEVGHGLITYNGWKGLLGMEISGSLNIKGTMYEDDYTGATIP